MEPLQNDKLEKAQKKVKDIKGFYSHLVVFIVINTFLIIVQMYQFNFEFDDMKIAVFGYLSTPFFWGIGLLFHGLYVFQHKFSFFREWEERKIKEYMEKDEEEFKNTTKWN
jgi:hypothetical protein